MANWTWTATNEVGEPVPIEQEEFGSQSDAESWLGLNWQELREAGAVHVALHRTEGQQAAIEVYQMSLADAES